jgi:hypothetical protein
MAGVAPRITRAALAALVVLAVLVPTGAAAQPVRYAVLVQGASGEPQFAEQHRGWLDAVATTLRDNFKIAPDHVRVLAERPGVGEVRSTADEVRTALGAIAASATASDVVFVFLVGHGTGDGDAAKFNLIGPDLTVAEWNDLLTPIKARVVFVNTASVSFPFAKGVTGDRRIVITATAQPAQKYATIFADGFAKALSAPEADLDKNNRISMWEAFAYASRLQKEYFEQKGLLATERALIEDNGDGEGRGADSTDGQDGMLATMTYLDAVVEARPSDPQLQMLLQRQELLTQQVDELRRKKPSMPTAEYDAAWEKLMVELATLGAEIRKKGGGI